MSNEQQHTESGNSPPDTIAGYRVHPAANLFPIMSEVELQTLADDIKAHGQRDPVLLIGASGSASRSEDQVIDGRNRLLACELAGFEPEVSWCDGDIDPIAFVLSKNLHRRHLTASQRAMIALDVEKMYAEQAKEQERTRADDGQFIQGAKNIPVGKSADKAAEVMEVSPAYVKKAKALDKADPELAADVKAGKVSLSSATAKPLTPMQMRMKKAKADRKAVDEWLASLPEPRDIYQDIRDVMNTQGITGQSKAVREARLAWFTAHTNFTAPADDSPPTAETWGALVEAARAYREATPDPPKGKRTAKAEPEPKLCRIVLDDDLTRRNQQSKDWRQCGKPVVFASFCDEHKTTPAVEPDPFMVRK